jgi:hypothetical protein
LGVWKAALIVFGGFFFEFMASFSLRANNFLISNPLLTIVSVSDASRGGVQILFGHQKQWSPPFGSGVVFDHRLVCEL